MTPTYNETYATVLVYIGKDRARLDAWHKQAEAEGLTVGKWLAKLDWLKPANKFTPS